MSRTDGREQMADVLNRYIRVGSVKGRVLIAVLTVIAVGFIIWAFCGSIPYTSLYGAVVAQSGPDDRHLCMAFADVQDSPGRISQGTPATVKMADGTSYAGTVEAMTDKPLSLEEIKDELSLAESETGVLTDWTMGQLESGSGYWYLIAIETEKDISDHFLQTAGAEVLTSEVRPISFLMN